MARAQLVLGVLLAGALVWAYRVAHPPEDAPRPGEGGVTLWRLPERAVERVEYRDGGQRVVIRAERSGGEDEPYLWVETRLPRRPAGHGGQRPEARAEGGPLAERAFKGNRRARQVLAFFAHPRATRELGSLEALGREKFGFAGELRTVEVWRRDEAEPRRMELGRNLPGNAAVYAHLPRTGRVYLVPLRSFRFLARAAQALMDRGLLSIQPGAAARIEVSDGRRSRTLWRMKPAGQWGATREAVAPVAQAPGFLSALANLRIAEYLEAPAQGREAGRTLLEARLYEAAEGPPREVVRIYQDEQGRLVARSRNTRRPVTVDPEVARALLKRLQGLLDGA